MNNVMLLEPLPFFIVGVVVIVFIIIPVLLLIAITRWVFRVNETVKLLQEIKSGINNIK